MRETRLAAPGGGFCRWVAWYILGYMRRVVMRYGVACLGWYIVGYARRGGGAATASPRASAHAAAGASPRPPLASWVRGCTVHAARHGCGGAPCTPRASVSSGLPPQETRHVPPGTDHRRASRPHQPSEVWRAAALQVKSYRPAPPGGRGVCAPRRKHSLHVSPAAPKAQGKRAPPVGKDRQRRAFPTPAVRRGFSDELIAVCRSSPRCPR